MKKIVTATALVLCIAFTQSANAGGIPVFDGVQEANAIDQIAKMKLQYDEMITQTNKLQATYELMQGNRPQFGSILNDDRYKNYVPDDFKETYDNLKSGDYSKLTTSGQKALENNDLVDDKKMISMCSNLGTAQQRACERQVKLAAQDRGFSGDAYDKTKGRNDRIQELISKISNTNDQKAILELNARIQAEQALIQNEALKLQIYRMVSESEKNLAEHQAHSANVSGILKTQNGSQGNMRVEPLKFKRQ